MKTNTLSDMYSSISISTADKPPGRYEQIEVLEKMTEELLGAMVMLDRLPVKDVEPLRHLFYTRIDFPAYVGINRQTPDVMALLTPNKTWKTPDGIPAIAKAVEFGHRKKPSSYQVLLSLAKHQSIKLPYEELEIESQENRVTLLGLLRPSEKATANCYPLFTRDELRAQLKQRGIKPRGARLKADYIERLTTADAEKPFPFLDLPPEIRVKIYSMVLQESRKLTPTSYAPELSSQAALTKVSRALRQETLPMFYALNTFTIFLHTPASNTAPNMCSDSAKWLTAIGNDNVNALRNFSFEIRWGWRMIVLHVDVGARKRDGHLDVMRTCAYHSLEKPGRCRRWSKSRKLRDVRKEVSKDEHEVPESVREWLSMAQEAIGEDGLSKFKITGLATTVGQMLYEMRDTFA